MDRIFIGRRSHWVLLALVIVFLYGVGLIRLHVTHFNSFIILLFTMVVGLLLVLRRTADPDDKRIDDD